MIRAVSLLAAAAAALAAPAHALSCARPDLARSILRAREAAEVYAILHGTLDFDESAMPAPVDETPPAIPATVPARFEGAALGAEGWVPHRAAVTIQPTCAGPWCGHVPSGEDWLLVVQADVEGGYTLEAGPCGGSAFVDPDAAMLDLARSCATGGACRPAG